MSKVSASQYKTNLNLRYPDNTAGNIVPSDDRQQHTDAADSFINEIDLVGSGSNSGVGGKNFPEALVDGANINWALDNRIDGMAILSSTQAAIAFTLTNFRLGTERILRVKKTISGNLTLNMVSAEAITFFDFYRQADGAAIVLAAASNSYFIVHFRNFGDRIFWHLETP